MRVATSVEDAIAARAAGATFAAGMTVLQLGWGTSGPDRPLVDITRLAGLCDIAPTSEGLKIGALVDLETLRTNLLAQHAIPVVTELLGLVGGLGIRHLGTVGGNVAWGAGDLVPVLMALDARLETTAGTSTVDAPAAGALILAVIAPRQPAVAFAEKVGYRAAFSPSLVTIAGCAQRHGSRLANARLTIGGGPNPPQRLPGAEQVLASIDPKDFDEVAFASLVAAEARCGSDAFASATHRAEVAGRVIAAHVAEALR